LKLNDDDDGCVDASATDTGASASMSRPTTRGMWQRTAAAAAAAGWDVVVDGV